MRNRCGRRSFSDAFHCVSTISRISFWSCGTASFFASTSSFWLSYFCHVWSLYPHHVQNEPLHRMPSHAEFINLFLQFGPFLVCYSLSFARILSSGHVFFAYWSYFAGIKRAENEKQSNCSEKETKLPQNDWCRVRFAFCSAVTSILSYGFQCA